MEYFFEDQENKQNLIQIMTEWLDTPFRHKTCVKGMGCDCIHFVGGVLAELGLCVVKRVELPDYPKDYHLHNTKELLAEGLEREFNVEKLRLTDKLITGDIILSHYGKASGHAGLFHDGYVYQALNRIGVKRIRFTDPKFRAQMKFAYRLLKDQQKGSTQ